MKLACNGANGGIGEVGHQVAQTLRIQGLAYVGEENDLALRRRKPVIQSRRFAAVPRGEQSHSLAVALANDGFSAVGRAIRDHNDMDKLGWIIEREKHVQFLID